MKHKVISPDSYKSQTWRNGGGSTLEMYRLPESANDFLLRISLANVNESGPFSVFPGIARTIVQIDGLPMVLCQNKIEELSSSEKAVVLQLWEPFEFSGNWEIDCQVLESCRDFNVMAKADRVTHRVRVLHDQADFGIDPTGDIALIYSESSSITLLAEKGNEKILPKHLVVVEKSGVSSEMAFLSDLMGPIIVVDVTLQ